MNIFSKNEFWYTVATIVTSIATAFVIYFLTQNKRQGKKYVLDLFKANQKLSLEVQKNISEFIDRHDAYNLIAFLERNVTYGHYLELMREEFKENLSDNVYECLKKMKFTKPSIDSMTNSLNKQNESLRLIDIDIKLVMKKADSLM